MSDYPPLTPEEEETLLTLQYQQAMAEWSAAETARLAELALFEPLDDCGDLPTVLAALTAIEESDVSEDVKARIDRIKIVLNVDLQALINRRAMLSVPIPEPINPLGEEEE